MKKILNHLKSDWYKYAIELVVITAGILGAYALNNWNEGRKIRESEQVILRNLKEELLANKQAFQEISDQHELSKNCTVELLKYFGRDVSTVPNETFDTLTFHSEAWYTFEPLDGYMKSIISSGKLDHLRNEKLKAMITAFDGKVIDATQEGIHVHRLQHDRLWPKSEGKVSHVKRMNVGFPDVGNGGYDSDYEWYFRNRELEDIIVNIFSWQNGSLNGERLFASHIDEMLELVEEEIK